jgi:hypothetical protein
MAVPVPPKRAGRPTDPLHIRCPELRGIVASSGVPCNRCIAHLLRGVDTTDHPLGSGGGDTGPVERFLLVVVVVVVAVVVAVVLERRRPEAPTQGDWAVPAQLDRADFVRPDAPWLVAVFTSATCDSCAQAVERSKVLASDAVAVEEVEVKARPDLHRRYHIDAVPIIVVADTEGVVRTSFTGPPSAIDLWAAVASVRDADEPAPGPEPPPPPLLA